MNYPFSRMRDVAQEIEDAAAFFARAYGNGLTHNGSFFGSGLVDLAPEIVEFIELDTNEWEQKVKLHAMSQALAHIPEE
jgi:hypothetical protein